MGNRIVADPDRTHGYTYRGRVVGARRGRYRGLIDKHYMGWREHDHSGRFRTFEEAEAWCSRWLDEMEHQLDGRIVQERPVGEGETT